MSEENKTLVRKSFNAIDRQDLATFQKALAPKFHAVFSDVAKRAHAAFPDMKITVDDVISEGDKVVTRWTMTGTHKGLARHSRLGEVKPTGRAVKVQGITIHEIQNGVIVNTWGVTAKLEALEQLGLVGDFAKVAQQHH
jgi:predicted ester cyclase